MRVNIEFLLSNTIQEFKVFINTNKHNLRLDDSFDSREEYIKHVKQVIKNHKRDMKKMESNDRFNAYTNLRFLKAYLALVKI